MSTESPFMRCKKCGRLSLRTVDRICLSCSMPDFIARTYSGTEAQYHAETANVERLLKEIEQSSPRCQSGAEGG